MNPALFGTLALAGVVALDAAPVAQTLLFQPLVTATLVGLMWGDLQLALEVGVVLQILAASTQPLGARTPEDYASGGVVGAATAMLASQLGPYAMVREASALAGVFAGLAVALAGVPLIKWQRRRNEGLARWCEAEIRRGDAGVLARAQAAAVVLAFAVGVGYCAVALAVSAWVSGPLVAQHSIRLSRAWELAQPLWLGLGLAYLLNAFLQRRLTRAAAFGFALMGAWLLLMVGPR